MCYVRFAEPNIQVPLRKIPEGEASGTCLRVKPQEDA
jgi:hypothetical protein